MEMPEQRAAPTGRNLYQHLGKGEGFMFAPEWQAASETLRDAGIPGIKYLDQGSRGAGAGTSNYVVFNDQLIDILKRYGLLGAPAGVLGLSAANSPTAE
jgi:hypothetical protein